MLKNIPPILSPELLKILCEMGHGDRIVIGDGNFPAASNAKRLIRADGHGVPELLDSILTVIPLDKYVDCPAQLMALTPDDAVKLGDPPIWKEYAEIIERHEPETKMGQIERFAFYEEARKAYAVIATGESAIYANIILQKGVI
ncbi:MAG: fucose isomerase [Clostridia bacterium]|nr:fucose isomerase [Clostridia bacterium]